MSKGVCDFYRFGSFRFSPKQKTLWREDELVSLSPTALEVLDILLEKRPEPATRDELLERVWKDTAVEEANVTVAISNIRKSLSSNGSAEKEFIRTIPKKGYLFVGEVEEVFESGNEGEAAIPIPEVPKHTPRWYLIAILVVTTLFVSSFSVWLTWGDGSEISSIPIGEREFKSVAVLPLRQIGMENSPLAIGITDNLISRLGKINKFAVRPLSAVESYEEEGGNALEFAKKLKADAVVVGTIQQEGNQIRVSLRMLDARDGAQLWNGTYDEEEKNVFELQDRLSIKVAENLISKLTEEESRALTKKETANLDAYRAYNTGNFYFSKRTRSDIEKSITFFEKAVELDPGYAAAYSNLASSLLLLTDSAQGGNPQDVKRERIQKTIDKAIELDPNSASAFASQGFLNVTYDWDIDTSLKNYDRSIELDPNVGITRNWKAWSLMAKKRFKEADQEMRLAKTLDPTSRIIAAEAGLPLLFSGDLDNAEPLFREAVELDANFFQSRYRMWTWFHYSGRHAQALKELEEIKRLSSATEPFYLGFRAITLSQTGQKQEAESIFADLEKRAVNENVSPVMLASVATYLDQKEVARQWLEKAYQERNDYLLYLDIVPEYKPLAKESWFKELLAKVKNQN